MKVAQNWLWTPVPDHLLEALAGYKIPIAHYRVLLWLLRATMGHKRPSGAPDPHDHVTISLNQLAKEMGADRGNTSRAVYGLIECRAVLQVDNGEQSRGRPSTYQINPETHLWSYEWLRQGSPPRPRPLALPADSPRADQVDPGSNLHLGSKLHTCVKTTLGVGSNLHLGVVSNLHGGKAHEPHNGAGLRALSEKKREEERSTLPSIEAEQTSLPPPDDLTQAIFVAISKVFYPFGTAPRASLRQIADFTAAFRRWPDEVRTAVRVEMAEIKRQNERDREAGRRGLDHPITPLLNRAAERMKRAGYGPEKHSEEATT